MPQVSGISDEARVVKMPLGWPYDLLTNSVNKR